MLPDHLVCREIPGLNEAILATEYAQIEHNTMERVIDSVEDGQLLGAQYRGVWYVEAPPFCEDRLSRLRNQQQSNEHARDRTQSKPSPQPVSDEIAHARVLGLRGKVTISDIKRHYRERMQEYHPDKVATLGPKLRELAEEESKNINAAYEFFATKYASNRSA